MDLGNNYHAEDKTLGEFLKDFNIEKSVIGKIDHINESDETKMLLASRIESDIQQYLPDIADIWGDETVVVKVKENDAFVVWKDHWMPTIDFYRLVSLNSGVVEPKDFERYENLS